MNELDFIQTVKIQGKGYLLNGTINVPKADGNREYELIKQWLSEGNIPELEFTDNELVAIEIVNKVQEAQYLLNSTEFKFNEDYDEKYTPEWEELKLKRAEARAYIRENK